MYKAAIGLGIALSLAGCNTTDLQGIQHALSSKPTEIALTPNRYWAGQAYQPRSRSKTWTIEGYIVPRRASRMTYPSLGCAAEWAFKAGDPAGKLTYREEIYHDPKNTCVKSLDVSVKAIDATTVEYKSYNPDGSVSATGQLKPAPVPVPFNLEGDWSGFAKNAKGQKTEIQVRLRRNEQSLSHQFKDGCTAELYYNSVVRGALGMDEQTGVSEMPGITCDYGGLVIFAPVNGNTLIRRAHNEKNQIISETTQTRMK